MTFVRYNRRERGVVLVENCAVSDVGCDIHFAAHSRMYIDV